MRHWLALLALASITVPTGVAADPSRGYRQPIAPGPEFRRLFKAAKRGDLGAQNALGERFVDGRDGTYDHAEAAKWFGLAANKGHAGAQFNLCKLAMMSKRRVSRLEGEDLRWCLAAAEQGHAEAQDRIGQHYSLGQDDGDAERAFSWYVKAAAQGLANAQHWVGLLYRDGRGVDMDEKAAVEWLRKASSQNLAGASFNLGLMYEQGRGVTKDEGAAIEWYRRAVAQSRGRTEAAYRLGVLYHEGRGTPKNLAEAARWFERLGPGGFLDASYVTVQACRKSWIISIS